MSAHTAAVYRRIATLFLALTAGVLVMAAYIVFSSAHVVVLSAPQDVKGDFIVDVSRTPDAAEIKGDVFVLSDAATETFPSTSVVGVDQPAVGKVRISSSIGRAQTLIATTRLLTADQTLFRIKQTVVVPANGSVTVDAFATEAGTKGQVPKDTAFTIPGLNDALRPKFAVAAVDDFVSGKQEIRSITQEDLDKAADALKKKLLDGLSDKLKQAAVTAGAPTTGQLVVASDVNRDTSAVLGSDAADFPMTVTVKAVGVFYDGIAFDAQVKKRLAEKLYDGRVITTVDPTSLERTVEKQDTVSGRANIGVTVRGTSSLSATSAALSPEKLTGITDDAAKQYLESVDGVASASVKTVPFWMHRMPNVAGHITVEVR
ncbi:MAG: hypothetical protein RLZZ324_758 [Candidatus Parcubacteria bacterium]